MNREICRKCSCDDCVMFIKFAKNGKGQYMHVRRWSVGTDLMSSIMNEIELQKADIALAKRPSGGFWCRNMESETWRDSFEWRFDGLIPEDGSDCECYAEQLMDFLDKEGR